MEREQIVTHGDFDGIVSAALVGLWTGIESVFFTGPESIRRANIGPVDIVCDLPHPAVTVRAWFDHHPGNIEEAQQMGWSVGEGAAVAAPSAARVIYEHLKMTVPFPEFLAETVDATDIVDTMGYDSIEQWLEPTPYNVINETIFLPGESLSQARRYLYELVVKSQKYPLEELVGDPQVQMRYRQSQDHAKRATETIKRAGKMIADEKICLLDFSEMKVAPRFSKNLAYTVFPKSEAVLSVLPVMERGRKSNNLKVSLSLNPFLKSAEQAHDCAALFDQLDIGGGHPGAAGGKLNAHSKADRLKLKAKLFEDLDRLWSEQTKRNST